MDTNEDAIDGSHPMGESRTLRKLLIIREANESATLVLF